MKHLLLKYHDDSASSSAKGVKPNRGALAAKTRAKSAHLYSKADHEWQSIDIILNPAEWNWRFGGRKPPHSRQRASGIWTCPFTRDEILTIWQSASISILSSGGSINKHLIDEDSRRTRDLLLHYNGAFEDFSCCQGIAAAAAASCSSSDDSNGSSGNVDDRCHLIQAELDRALFCQDDFLVSSILNGNPQRFPTHILRLELERELDRLLIDQILLREQEDQMQTGDGAGSTYGGTKKVLVPFEQIVNEDATTSNVAASQAKARGVGVGEALKEQKDDRSHQDNILFQRRGDATKERQKELDRAENTVRFGLLLLVFGYFRSQFLARKRLSEAHDVVLGGRQGQENSK